MGGHQIWDQILMSSHPGARDVYKRQMQSRTYGGDRGHEGCDIMADINERGNYPVISVSDGTIEQMGWLELGGYRIGIRSPHGAYFYYAHLSDYAEGLSIGDEIHAGELIAFMGDTGYSKTCLLYTSRCV